MSVPKAVFLDTSILDGQQYNFSSTALTTFAPACAERGIKLLLPDPTEREVKRHIKGRSLEALAALEDARRKAPFLAKWRGLPQNLRSPMVEEWEVHRIANEEWVAFLKQFSVVRLGYDKLDVSMVMRWYDKSEAPFRQGKKRKEFPDAFAIAMLDAYAQREKIYVAVVAADNDFKLACGRFGSLLYFSSVPRLTEVLLSNDARVEKLRTAIEAKKDIIEAAILEEAPALSVHHAEERFEVHGVGYEGLQSLDLSIVALGDDECTVAFTASLAVDVELRWEEFDEEGTHVVSHDVRDEMVVTGTAKVGYSAGAETVTGVTFVAFDDLDAAISETPYGWR